jgi:hypothetical protein
LSALRVARFAGEAGTAAAGAVDPHYKLVINATDPNSQDALVHDSTIFPIVTGPWVANTDRSKWIAPLVNSVEAAGGDYAYRTTFDLRAMTPPRPCCWALGQRTTWARTSN